MTQLTDDDEDDFEQELLARLAGLDKSARDVDPGCDPDFGYTRLPGADDPQPF